jgi:hypothetical protein
VAQAIAHSAWQVLVPRILGRASNGDRRHVEKPTSRRHDYLALSVRRIAVPPPARAKTGLAAWSPTFEAIRLGWQHYQQGPGEA